MTLMTYGLRVTPAVRIEHVASTTVPFGFAAHSLCPDPRHMVGMDERPATPGIRPPGRALAQIRKGGEPDHAAERDDYQTEEGLPH